MLFQFVIFTSFWFKCLIAVNDVSLPLQSTQLNLDNQFKILSGLLTDQQACEAASYHQGLPTFLNGSGEIVLFDDPFH